MSIVVDKYPIHNACLYRFTRIYNNRLFKAKNTASGAIIVTHSFIPLRKRYPINMKITTTKIQRNLTISFSPHLTSSLNKKLKRLLIKPKQLWFHTNICYFNIP